MAANQATARSGNEIPPRAKSRRTGKPNSDLGPGGSSSIKLRGSSSGKEPRGDVVSSLNSQALKQPKATDFPVGLRTNVAIGTE